MSAKGSFFYYDPTNTLKPLPHALVQLFDANITGDLFLGAAFTDANGYWEIGPFSSAGPDGQRHLFARVRAENASRGVRVEDTKGNTYSWRAPSTLDVQLDGWKDFGAQPVPPGNADAPAFWVFVTLNQGWSYFPSSPGGVTARWAPGYNPGTAFCPNLAIGCWPNEWGKVRLNEIHAEFPSAILHEFGHNVMYNLYGTWLPPNDCPSGHFVNKESGSTCAWTEGFQ